MGLRDGDASTYDSLDNVLDAEASAFTLTDETATVAASNTYDPFGITTRIGSATANNPYTYASGQAQPTGLVKFGTRYYDPALGRWTQQDPIGCEEDGGGVYSYIIIQDPT